MLVIIPACGRGERFKKQGYELIKPLIPVMGRTMIDAVVEALYLDVMRVMNVSSVRTSKLS